MKQLNTLLGIVSISTFLFYLTLEVNPLEIDLENLSSIGYVEYLDGRIYLTIHDSLSFHDVRTIQRIDSFYELEIIVSLNEEIVPNSLLRPREPP